MATYRQTPTGRWRAQVFLGTDPNTGKGVFRSKTLDTKTLAKRWANQAEMARDEGAVTTRSQADAADGRLTVGEYWRTVVLPWRRVNRERATVARNVTHWTKHLAPTFDTMALTAVRRSHINAWVTERAEAGVGTPTIQAAVGLLSAIYAHAMDNEMTDTNPALGIRTPSHRAADKGYLSREEVGAILSHISEPYRLFLELTAETGLRFGEAAGILREAVAPDASRVLVRTVWTRWGLKDGPKNAGSERTVPVPSYLRPRLAALVMATPPGCMVFTGPHGGGLSDSNLRQRVLARACDAAGVRRIGLHHLRHAYASWLTEAGVSPWDVAGAMGHTSTRMLDRYKHLAPGHGDRILAGLEASRRPNTAATESGRKAG